MATGAPAPAPGCCGVSPAVRRPSAFSAAWPEADGLRDQPVDRLVDELAQALDDLDDLLGDVADPDLVGEEADRDRDRAARPRSTIAAPGLDVAGGDLGDRRDVVVDDLEDLAQVLDRRLHGVEEGDAAVDDGHDRRSGRASRSAARRRC